MNKVNYTSKQEKRIPRLIHYIWLGSGNRNRLIKRCITSWNYNLSDYQIIEWSEKNCIDLIKSNQYANEAFSNKKYAFVSDYLRLEILFKYGGIYVDTDVEILKSLDPFLNDAAFASFEDEKHIQTALIGAEQGNSWIKMLLDYYQEVKFIDGQGKQNTKTNVEIVTELSEGCGFIRNGQEQILNFGVHIYPKEFFCPISTQHERLNCFTENTYAVHHFNGSWLPKWRRLLSKARKKTGFDPRKVFQSKLGE